MPGIQQGGIHMVLGIRELTFYHRSRHWAGHYWNKWKYRLLYKWMTKQTSLVWRARKECYEGVILKLNWRKNRSQSGERDRKSIIERKKMCLKLPKQKGTQWIWVSERKPRWLWGKSKERSDIDEEMGRDQILPRLMCHVNEFRHCLKSLGSLWKV